MISRSYHQSLIAVEHHVMTFNALLIETLLPSEFSTDEKLNEEVFDLDMLN